MNWRSMVTMTMFWMEETDTMTAWMTVLRPLARWMARSGRRTLKTRRIFSTDTAPALPANRMETSETPTTRISVKRLSELFVSGSHF